jgi:hypothetical protein
MVKRILFICIVILMSFALHALELSIDGIQPNQIALSWARVPSALTYDVYLDDRYQGTVNTPFYKIEHLVSHTSYDVRIEAKRGESVIDRETIEATTSGWEGRYRWVNKTRKDNRGRTTSLDYRVEYVQGEYVVYGLHEGRWYEVFPLIEPHQIGEQFEYQGTRPEEIAYKYNAQLFNTTAITPRFWKVLELKRSADELLIRVETRVGALRYTALSRYAFALDDAGNRVLRFSIEELGSNSWAIFSSPNEGEEGVFVALAIR